MAEALLHGFKAQLIGRTSFVEINGHKAQVQVATRGSWQIANVDKFLQGDAPYAVLVDLSGRGPEFYIVPGKKLREIVETRHSAYLKRVGGVRPRNPSSKHAAIDPSRVRRWRDRWSVFERGARKTRAT
jgi:hypothetical protein